jgi:hypothetical protein
MQMAAEDGRRMSDGYQRFLQKFTRLLPNGWQPAGPERILDLAEHPVHFIRAKSADDTSNVWSRRMGGSAQIVPDRIRKTRPDANKHK